MDLNAQKIVTVTLIEDQNEKVYEHIPQEEFWSQHRTTLISYQAQFVNQLKPEMQVEEAQARRSKSKKKNIEYEGGFLFPGRPGDREQNIQAVILESKYNCLRDLFQQHPNSLKELVRLRQFIKIMLELKHSSILKEFLQIYEIVVREVRETKFEAIRQQADRFVVIGRIMTKLTALVQKCPYLFPYFAVYLRDSFKETTKLFKVTAYCFLAEWFSFQINQFYCEAFEFEQHEGKESKKRQKIEETGSSQ